MYMINSLQRLKNKENQEMKENVEKLSPRKSQVKGPFFLETTRSFSAKTI